MEQGIVKITTFIGLMGLTALLTDISGVKKNTQKSKLGAQQTDTIHIYNKYCHNNKYSSRQNE